MRKSDYEGYVIDIDDIWVTAADIPAICEITQTHRTTVARWIARRAFPPAVHRLLDIIYNGNLGAVHSDWQGFRVNPRTGELDTPLTRSNTPGEILAIQYRYQLIANLQAELRALKAEYEGTEDNGPTDAEVEILQREIAPGANVVALKKSG